MYLSRAQMEFFLTPYSSHKVYVSYHRSNIKNIILSVLYEHLNEFKSQAFKFHSKNKKILKRSYITFIRLGTNSVLGAMHIFKHIFSRKIYILGIGILHVKYVYIKLLE